MWRVIWFSDKNSTSDSVSFAETITWWTTWDLKVRLKQIHPKNCQYQVQGCLTQTPGLLGLSTCASLRPVLWIEIVTRFGRECKVAAAFLQGGNTRLHKPVQDESTFVANLSAAGRSLFSHKCFHQYFPGNDEGMRHHWVQIQRKVRKMNVQ